MPNPNTIPRPVTGSEALAYSLSQSHMPAAIYR